MTTAGQPLDEVFDIERFMYDVARRGQSTRALGRATGVSAGTLSQAMSGRVHPSMSTICRLADWVGLSLDAYRRPTI